jgi:hypothetical protein
MKPIFAKSWLPSPPDKYQHNRWVNLLADPTDYHVVLLASMGMTYRVISQQTGLSFSQISYRLHKANRGRAAHEKINSYNYRHGVSQASHEVIRLAAKRVSQIINPQLRENLAIDV